MIPNIFFYYRVNTNLANVRCTQNRWFTCKPNFTCSKLCVPAKSQLSCFLHLRMVRHISISGVSIFIPKKKKKTSQLNKIVFKQVEEMRRLNNDERNQAIGMLNAGMSATVVSRHFSRTRKTIERLRGRFRVTENSLNRY